MIQRFRTAASRFYEYIEILLGFGLSDVLFECMGTQRKLPVVLGLKGSGHQGILKNIISKINAHNNTIQRIKLFYHFLQGLPDDLLHRQSRIHTLERGGYFL